MKARELSNEQRLHIATASLLIVVVLAAIGFGVVSIGLVVGSLLFGIFIARSLFEHSNGSMFDSVLHNLYKWKFPSVQFVSAIIEKELGDIKASEEDRIRRMPWEGMTVPNSLNESLENLFNEIVEQYVNWWYGGSISRDRAFLNEIRYQLRYGAANIVKLIGRVNRAKFVSDVAIPISMLHVARINRMEKKIRDSNNGKTLPRSMVESKMAEMLTDLHVTQTGREQEAAYVRQIADYLIPRILDDTRLSGRSHDDDSPLRNVRCGKREMRWPSKCVRGFLREVLTNAVLLPLFDMIAQPDTINYWLICLFDENRNQQLQEPMDTSHVLLMKGLTEESSPSGNVPDSLLQLKLSEIVRDARLYSMFRMYLQDIRGPFHELQFLTEATRILESIQRKSESGSQIAYDVWQLFGQFVHEGAPERIILEQNLVDQYKVAVESKDLEVLESIIEASYQVIYNRLQFDFVVSFCQSECFLGHLCGSPPITINELIDRDAQEKRKNAPVEKTFSLSQLRARVRKALTSVSEDEEEESGIDKNEEEEDEAFSNVPSIDIISEEQQENSERVLEESIRESERIEKGNGLIMDSDARDLNCWKVNVSKVAPLKDTYTDNTIYVFVIDVERGDAKSHETRIWSIHRSFNEFYVLESKLLEFHGDSLRFSPLPTRKTFVTKNRPFMEQHRLIFATFISSLCKQKLLNRSELLLAFLSSNEEFRDTLNLSDLNPWKVVKKMPGKLSREKGQNLKPFLLKTLAVTLSPPVSIATDDTDRGSIDSGDQLPVTSLATNAIYSSVYGNNFGGIFEIRKSIFPNMEGYSLFSRSTFDSVLFIMWSSIKSHAGWISYIVLTIRAICGRSIDSVFRKIVEFVFASSLRVENLVYLVQHLHWSLFCNDQPPPTTQEMEMREELAKRRALEFVQNMVSSHRFIPGDHVKEVVSRMLEALQNPRMNKQLLYVLVDRLLEEMFEEFRTDPLHPLQ